MHCEACSVKFTLFKRKKQCTDCLRLFCSECVIKRLNKMLNCDSCSVLSRRPLVRSQIVQIRSRDLRQYLLAKKVCVKGCIEKEDLVSLLMLFANGSNYHSNAEPEANTRSGNASEANVNSFASGPPQCSENLERQDRPEPVNVERAESSQSRRTENETPEITRVGEVAIQEVSESDCNRNGEPIDEPIPLITEQEDTPSDSETQSTEIFSEISMSSGIVELSSINELSDLEHLSVRQLKILLSRNRVDYKGCVERCELLARATRLWEEHKQSTADVDRLAREDLCKICWDAPIECVILECGHMACCISCGIQMCECPICKQYVVRVIRFFKA